jgi:hypothetical protein
MPLQGTRNSAASISVKNKVSQNLPINNTKFPDTVTKTVLGILLEFLEQIYSLVSGLLFFFFYIVHHPVF